MTAQDGPLSVVADGEKDNKKGCSDEHPVITIFPCEIHGDLAPLICYFFFFFLAAFFLVAMS